MWWKYVRAGQPTYDNMIWRMRIACWVPKSTSTHSEYVTIYAFPLQQRSRERITVLYYWIFSLFFYLKSKPGHSVRGLISITKCLISRSQWPRGLRRRPLAARLLRLWVRIPPGTWIFVCCECCVLSGRGLCDGLIIRPEESYRMWRVVVCDQETS